MQMNSRTPDKRWPKLSQLNVYELISDKTTKDLMLSCALQRWTFPMTLYFEAHRSDEDELLKLSLQLQKMHSIKKNLYVTEHRWEREYIPAFKLTIENEAMLNEVFNALFYVAEQNFLFAITNEPNLFYKGYSLTTTSDTIEILTADYDGQGVIFMTKGRC